MKAILLTFILFSSFTEIYSQNTNWAIKNPLPQNDFYAAEFFDQNTGFCAGSRGSIYRTTDGGNIWTAALANQTKTIYDLHFLNALSGFGVGDSGIVLYTTTGGNNWAIQNSTLATCIRSISTNGASLAAAVGDEGYLLRTTNSGNMWLSTHIAFFNLYSIYCVDAANWYVCGDSNKVLKTTDAGQSWARYGVIQSVYPVVFRNIFFINQNKGFAAGEPGIYYTLNGGVNWSQTGYVATGNVRNVKFINENCGYAVGRNTPVRKTTNGGLNWFTTGPGNHYGGFWNDVEILDTDKIIIAGNEGMVFKSTNSGGNVTVIGGTTRYFYNLAFYDANNGIITGGNYILRTSNGADKWNIGSYGMNNWFEPTYYNYGLVKFSSYTNGYMVNQMTGISSYGSISRSNNGGQSWDAGGGYGGMFLFVDRLEAVGNSGVFIGRTGGLPQYIRKSDNGGQWNLIFQSTNQVLSDLSFINPNTGFVSGYINSTYNNILLKTTDGGLIWTQSDLPQQNRCKQINMLAGGYGYILCDTGMILQTANFGSNWTVQIGSNSKNFKCFQFLDQRHGYAISSNNRLAFSSNGGANWSLHEVGVTKNLNNLQFLDSLNGYIVGDSGTVLKTTNGGLTFFEPVSSNVPGRYYLSQNYPNPFNPTTTIRFDIPPLEGARGRTISLVIYDILGREITSLVNENLSSGTYEVIWDATNYPSGVYFYQLRVSSEQLTNEYSETKRMILLK